MTIAERMLEILDSEQTWTKGALRHHRLGETSVRRCLLGARLDAEEGKSYAHIQDNSTAVEVLFDDPVMATMARIIREQYPDLAGYLGGLNSPQLAMGFNDWGTPRGAEGSSKYPPRTQYTDIRAIIEKAIAEGM